MELIQKIEEDHLQSLKDRFLWLVTRLEETANRIEVISGSLQSADDQFLRLLNEYKESLIQARVYDNGWMARTLKVLSAQVEPCTAKDISALLCENQKRYSISTIHIQVRSALPILVKNGLVEVDSTTGYKKYSLSQ
jgi:hypothetical protein